MLANIVMVLSIIVTLISVVVMTYQMFQWFPFASPGKWWWLKYIPLLGGAFYFLGLSDGQMIFMIVGILMAISAYGIGSKLHPR